MADEPEEPETRETPDEESPGDAGTAAPVAPAVVAVVVTHDPGSWFSEVLAGLAAQDYPNLAVLVLDNASAADPTPLVAEHLPQAYVHRCETNPGFGAACNEALRLVEGAAFFCFLHDDVALEPPTVRLLVEEAFRSNAGVVGPKLVSWDDPMELRQVGMGIDKTGALAPYVEPGERDQEQHDAVRDVFVVPGGCQLVRADLFRALEGFDTGIEMLGEDLDLCWRAHCAGARVMVAPSARVRHREAYLERRTGQDQRRRWLARHRLRTTLTCYGTISLIRVVPQIVVLALAEIVYAAVAGRTRQAREIGGAWPWNLRRLGEIARNRRRLNQIRQVPDNEIRDLQVRGSARLTAFLRGQIGGGDDRLSTVAAASRTFVTSLRTGPRRAALAAWALAFVVVVIGSRHLVTRSLPAIGQFAPAPPSTSGLLRAFTSGWRYTGLGSTDAAPTGLGLLWLVDLACFGAGALARTVIIIGPIVLGAVGAWRMARPFASARARAGALAAYVVNPVPWNALANGHHTGLVVYGAMPWILVRVARASRLAPYGSRQGEPGRVRSRWLPAQIVGLGLVTALAAAVVPLAVVLPLAVALVVLVACPLVGGWRGALAAGGVALGAGVVAFALHLPWALDLVRRDGAWSALGGVDPSGAPDLGLARLLRFQTGPMGAGPLGYALLVAAALGLLTGREWRLAWATRAWFLAGAAFATAWAVDRAWIDRGLLDPDTLLAPAACGLALAVACGLSAFERDLRGFGFGWRQVVSGGAFVALVLAAVPAVGGAVDGRWDMPSSDFARAMRFLDASGGNTGGAAETADGEFRVLWIGHPDVVPTGAWELADGVAWGLSVGYPDLGDRWAGTPSDATALVETVLRDAADGRTVRLGRLLGPLGIRYVVVLRQAAPAFDDLPEHPMPERLEAALGSQLDLERVEVDEAVDMYENVAWYPLCASADDDLARASRGTTLAAAAAIEPVAGPALAGCGKAGTAHGPATGGTATGGTATGGTVLVAQAFDADWKLTVDGRSIDPRPAFGVTVAFDVGTDSGATALWFGGPSHRLVAGAQAAGWLVALWLLRRGVVKGWRQ